MPDEEQPNAQVISPMGGPSFAVPPWFLAAQQQGQGISTPPPPTFSGGAPDVPPEVLAHYLGTSSPPPGASQPQGAGTAPKGPGMSPAVAPSPKPGSPQALQTSADESQRGVREQEAGLQGEQAAAGQRGEAEAAKAAEDQAALEQQNDTLYGKPNEQGIRQGGIVAERQRMVEDYQKGREKRIGEYNQATDAWANTKIDEGRRWADLSTGRKLVASIGIALSGIGMAMARKPGENPALKMIEDAIQSDVQVQMQQQHHLGDIAQQKHNSLADYRQQSEDDLASYNRKVAEEYKRTADQVELAGARHGGDIAKANAAMYAAQLRQKAGALIEQAATRTWDRDFRVSESQRQAKEHQQSIGVQYSQMAQQERHFKATMDQQKTFHDDEVNAKAAQLELAGRKEDAAELKAKHATVSQHGILAPQGIDKQGNASWDYIKNADGTPYTAPEKASEKIHEMYRGGAQMIDALDKLRELRHANGGDFNKWSADARAKAMEYERVLIGAHQAAGIAGFRGNVMEVMDKATAGGADPTSVIQSVMPELDRARDNAVGDLNSMLHRQGNYDGKDLTFDDPLKAPKAPESVEKQQHRQLEQALPEGQSIAPGAGTLDIKSGYKAPSEEGVRAQKSGMVESQLQVFDQLETGVKSQDPTERKHAMDALEWASENAATKEMRTYATKLLGRAITAPQPQARPQPPMVAGHP